MAKKKQGGMYLLLAAAGIGIFIYSRKKKEEKKAVVKEIVKEIAVENAKEVQGYFTMGH